MQEMLAKRMFNVSERDLSSLGLCLQELGKFSRAGNFLIEGSRAMLAKGILCHEGYICKKDSLRRVQSLREERFLVRVLSARDGHFRNSNSRSRKYPHDGRSFMKVLLTGKRGVLLWTKCMPELSNQ